MSQAGVRADLVELAPDDEARLQPRLDEDEGEHRAVVVLPWVPATAMVLRSGTDRLQQLGPREHRDPEARASTHLDVVRPTAVEVSASAPCDVRGPVADRDLDARGPAAAGGGGGLDVTAGTCDGPSRPAPPHRAHAGTAHADDVHVEGLGEVDPRVVEVVMTPPWTPTRRGRPPGRQSPGDRRPTPPELMASRRSGSGDQTRRRSPPDARPCTRRRRSRPAAPTQVRASALRVWWSLGAPGSGTGHLGVPMAASSATVRAPARRARSRRRRAGPASAARSRRAGSRDRSRAPAAGRAEAVGFALDGGEVALPRHVVDRDVVRGRPRTGPARGRRRSGGGHRASRLRRRGESARQEPRGLRGPPRVLAQSAAPRRPPCAVAHR